MEGANCEIADMVLADGFFERSRFGIGSCNLSISPPILLLTKWLNVEGDPECSYETSIHCVSEILLSSAFLTASAISRINSGL